MSENIIDDVVEIEPETIVEDVPAVDEISEVNEIKEIKTTKEIKETKEIPVAKKRGRPAGSTNKAVRMKPPVSEPLLPQRHAEPERPNPSQQELDYDLLARTMRAVMENRQIQRHAQRNALYNSFF